MFVRRLVSASAGLVVAGSLMLAPASTAPAAAPSRQLVVASAASLVPVATHYSNCAKLNKKYPHGVGKKGAKDHTSGKPVTNFTRNNSVYAANKARDRDKDGIACEKH